MSLVDKLREEYRLVRLGTGRRGGLHALGLVLPAGGGDA